MYQLPINMPQAPWGNPKRKSRLEHRAAEINFRHGMLRSFQDEDRGEGSFTY